MKEIEKMSIAEISKLLNISISNVKIRNYRAKKLLKEQLLNSIPMERIFEIGHDRCDGIVNKVCLNIKIKL